MSRPSPLELSMYADGALTGADAEAVAAEVAASETYRSEVALLKDESRQLGTAMGMEIEDLPVPAFPRPASLRGFAMANVVTGLVIWLAQFLWKTLFGEVIVEATTWLTSVYLPDIYAVASGSVLYLIEEGTAMLDAYLVIIVLTVLAVTALALLFKYRQSRSGASFCAIAALLAVTALSAPPTHALEVRRGEGVVTVAAAETIDDTLVVAAETAVIDGDVTGDLVVVGRSIDVSGDVGGNIVAFAESVKIRGSVGGTVMGAASAYNLTDATVGGDVWVAGEKVGAAGSTQVDGNVTFAGNSVTIEGGVDKDLYAFGESVELSGSLGEDLEAFANRLRLLGDASVGGDVRFRTGNKDNLFRAEGVEIAGAVEFLDMPEEMQPANKYATIEFYLWQIARLIAAFLVGWALLTLLPGMRNISLAGGVEGLKSAGIGFLAVLAVPIAAVLVAITIIGLPFALIAFGIWLLGLYLSQIVIARVIGSSLVADNLPLSLLAGLVIVLVAVNLPFLGEVIDFILTIVGLGLLVQYLFRLIANRGDGGASPSFA